MATPHINLEDKSKIAKTVLMPGDPLRAKFIAEKYLTDVELVNTVRNMFGYTGYYKGEKVTVFGSGMGMPSIGIYSYELFKFYDVENIIRIGSAGSYQKELGLYELVLAAQAYSESTFGKCLNGHEGNIALPSKKLNDLIIEKSKELDYKLSVGTIHSSDVFYHSDLNYYENNLKEIAPLCVEMESYALFLNAKQLGKNAACLLTISDNLVTHELTTAEERQNSFNKMMILALETAISK